MKKYVCGFYFNRQKTHVVLIWKEKPAWQKGKLNGIGGKIEEGETPADAMAREFEEETGLTHRAWFCFITIHGEGWECNFFAAIDFENNFEYAETKESEEVAKIEIDRLDDYDYIDNLRWLVPMAKYKLENPKLIFSTT